jgi:hypothetical protein
MATHLAPTRPKLRAVGAENDGDCSWEARVYLKSKKMCRSGFKKLQKDESPARTSTADDIAQIGLSPNWTSYVESSCLKKRNKPEKTKKNRLP